MKTRLKLWAALILCLCALLLCGSALAVDIAVPVNLEHGTILVAVGGEQIEDDGADDDFIYYVADVGDTVTLTGSPDAGYRLASCGAYRVTDANFTPGAAVAEGDGTGVTFTVPDGLYAGTLLVQAAFEEGSSAYSVTTAVPDDGGTGNTVTVDKASAEAGEIGRAHV